MEFGIRNKYNFPLASDPTGKGGGFLLFRAEDERTRHTNTHTDHPESLLRAISWQQMQKYIIVDVCEHVKAAYLSLDR